MGTTHTDADWTAYHDWLKADAKRWIRHTHSQAAWTAWSTPLAIGQCNCCDSSVTIPLADAVAAGLL